MRNLSVQQKSYIENYVSNERKSLIIGYVLWFFLGIFGVHRFYVGKTITGLVMLILGLICGLLTLISFGTLSFLTMAPITIWWFIDAVLIIFMVNNYNTRLRRIAYRDIIR
ncbi:TM2 domain-containing protein [Nosocomiicoccus ampullae]|uniref:TM2 domain-containing membrane protein YozV n=1 Tax=Nosocomiicoccus ampullae TaxID=489910 RepID=A0A9Q2HFA3_9STAP|nr:TM2 domain-containing protein [Nosocomiicoccus ampullae]MBB5175928.1 TM2 domain-containing membrane protein YozV [Nosocomiicoccus ampullae]QYA46737.1 TM2 domain-containing protein [Nosocomiicoccus ampullae]